MSCYEVVLVIPLAVREKISSLQWFGAANPVLAIININVGVFMRRQDYVREGDW